MEIFTGDYALKGDVWLTVKGLESIWFGVDAGSRAIEYSRTQDGTRFSLSTDHASTFHPGAPLCRRPFHRYSAAGGRLSSWEGRDLSILDLMDQSAQGLRFVPREPRRLPQRSLQILVSGIPTG
jgi:hypothetical protein